jgi:vacuolar-type H+-ATPase subunit H
MNEEGGLDLLIETEAKLAERLAAAQAEADSALEAARRAAGEAEAHYQAELEAASQELTARLAARRQREIGRIRAEADAAAHRFETLGSERIETLAREVVRRVLDAWRAEEPA